MQDRKGRCGGDKEGEKDVPRRGSKADQGTSGRTPAPDDRGLSGLGQLTQAKLQLWIVTRRWELNHHNQLDYRVRKN